MALLAPSSALAEITGCSTEQTSFYNSDEDANQHFFSDSITKQQAISGSDTAEVTVTCTSNFGIPTPTLVPAKTDASGTATEGAPTGTTTRTWTITWVPNQTNVAAGSNVYDHFVYSLDDGDPGVTTGEQVVVDFAANPQFDLSVANTSAASAAILPGGSDVTLTGTLKNAGPDVAVDKTFGFVFPAKNVTFVSASAGCTFSDAIEVQPGFAVFCSAGSIASGETKTFTATVKATPGANGLVVPSALKFIVADTFQQSSGDLNEANDSVETSISLVAATCAAGQTGTPPNCVTPTKNVPTTGNDTLFGTLGGDFIRAGAGDDRVSGGVGDDTLFGEVGNDVIFGGIGNDVVSGGEGNDRVDGGAGNDKVTGNSGNDKLGGGAGNDAVNGGAGNDKILGGAGNDKIAGASGNDTIVCGSGGDKVSGGAGNDKIGFKDGKGGDVINGGRGHDKCYGVVNDRFIACERITRV
jgi:Ca2+-binding RTX toxin-like protein